MSLAFRRSLQRRGITRAIHTEFDRIGLARLPIRTVCSQEPQTPTDVIIRKAKGGYDILVNQSLHGRGTGGVKTKAACCVYWFSRTSEAARQIVVSASDGDSLSLADYKFSSASQRHTLLPDPHFFRDKGYAATDAFASKHAIPWDDRSDDITWRGGINGTGLLTLDDDVVTKPGVVQRLHMAKKCQTLDVDFRFIPRRAEDRPFFQKAGLVGDFIPAHDWGAKKFAIDIDGFSNAWCNFMQRLKLGCCVLKVDSVFGFRQWYYDRIKPWEHYVPIRADLADLPTQVDWVRNNTDKAREIAANGQEFARKVTFESEAEFAGRAIESREAMQ